MPYYSPKESYNRYAFLRWWCQNQWWVQIVIPCILCAGVIGGLLYYWNNERQQQAQGKLLLMQYGYDKDHPPKLDPDLDEIAAAWRVIRMKKNDPSMPIPFKKKQLIVKHWKSIIVDMKVEEIQRLHDLLQDQPYKPTDDVEIDIRKIEAPWKDDDSLKDFGGNLEESTPEGENASKPAKAPASGGKNDGIPPASDSDSPSNGAESEKTAPENSPVKSDDPSPQEGESEIVPEQEPSAANDETEEENAFQEETPDQSPDSEKTENSKKPETPVKSVRYYPTSNASDSIEPILLDSPDEQTADDSTAQDASASYTDIDIIAPEQPKNAKGRFRSKKGVAQATAFEEEVEPLDDNFLQQREDFIKKALEERNRKIEEFKKSQDPYQFIPTPWKRNPIVI